MKNVIILILLSFLAFVSAGFLLPSEDESISPDKLQLKITSLSRDHLRDFETHVGILIKDFKAGKTGVCLEFLGIILNNAQALNNGIANEIKSIINFTIDMSGENL